MPVLNNRLTSARFIVTILVALSYTYLACTGLIPIDKVCEITLLIFTYYFLRNDRNNTQNNKPPTV